MQNITSIVLMPHKTTSTTKCSGSLTASAVVSGEKNSPKKESETKCNEGNSFDLQTHYSY